MSTPYYLQQPAKAPRTAPSEQLQEPEAVVPRLEVFLSHATADSEHVTLVRQQIEALGIAVYLAEHDVKPGTLVAEKVRAAIRRCHAVVVLITTTSIKSVYVQHEVGIAHECGKPLVPIVEKGIDTRKLGILQGVEYLELDLAQPAQSLAKITTSLQPPVLNQLSAMRVSVCVTQTSRLDPATAFMLVGIGLILGLFIATMLTSQTGGRA